MLLWPEKLDTPSVGHGWHCVSVHDVICIIMDNKKLSII